MPPMTAASMTPLSNMLSGLMLREASPEYNARLTLMSRFFELMVSRAMSSGLSSIWGEEGEREGGRERERGREGGRGEGGR